MERHFRLGITAWLLLCGFAAAQPVQEGSQDSGSRFWSRSEYLLWWTRGQSYPPLVTASPAGTPLASAGLLGQPTTGILFGGDRFDPDPRSGARFSAGAWLNEARTIGIEGSYFQLETETIRFSANPSSNPILLLPFFDQDGVQRRRITNFPGSIQGEVGLESSSRLYSGDAHVRLNVGRGPSGRVDALVGYRQLRLNEDFRFRDTEMDPTTRKIDILDQFNTRNLFQGGDLGVCAHFWRGPLSLEAIGRVALGVNEREVNVAGTSSFSVPGMAPVPQVGGFFALPSNSGRRSDDTFTAIPEASLNLGYRPTSWLRLTAGYTFLYWSHVVRPGDQIDTTVNLTQLPSVNGPGTLVGPARPAPFFKESDFWAHGMSFGLEFRY